MAHPDSIVIVGGGLAGAKGAEGLREQGFRGGLTVIGAEDQLPYERPPLSKSYLQGKSTLADAQVHTREWYDDNACRPPTGHDRYCGPTRCARDRTRRRGDDRLRRTAPRDRLDAAPTSGAGS